MTISFTYTAKIAVVTNIATNAGKLIYSREPILDENGVPIPWDSLTTAQQLAVVDKYVLRILIDLAKQWDVDDAAKTAISAVNAGASEKYTIGV